MKTRVLVVEDEPAISEPLSEHLTREGFDTDVAATVAGATEAFDRFDPDLILLDVMLPDGDGRDLCRAIRKRSDVIIIMLTARGEDVDKIVGPRTRCRRLRREAVQCRRAGRQDASHHASRPLDVHSARADPDRALSLDPAARTVTKDGEPVELAAKEFDLLHHLMAHAGDVCSRETIMDEVWDPHWFGPTKTLDVHISWLRKKIEDDPSTPRFITTVRGVGFRFAAPGDLG